MIDLLKNWQVIVGAIVGVSTLIGIVIKLYKFLTKKATEEKEALKKVIDDYYHKIESANKNIDLAVSLIKKQGDLNKLQDTHIKESRDDRKVLHNTLSCVQDGIKTMLGAHIDEIYRKCIHRGWINATELEQFIEHFNVYVENCGNGVRKIYYEQLIKLPVRQDEVLKNVRADHSTSTHS